MKEFSKYSGVCGRNVALKCIRELHTNNQAKHSIVQIQVPAKCSQSTKKTVIDSEQGTRQDSTETFSESRSSAVDPCVLHVSATTSLTHLFLSTRLVLLEVKIIYKPSLCP